jgi:hypothetical protein
MCATKICASAITIPASARGDERSAVVAAMSIIVEAFQEALAMRRAAQKRFPLGDE